MKLKAKCGCTGHTFKIIGLEAVQIDKMCDKHKEMSHNQQKINPIWREDKE